MNRFLVVAICSLVLFTSCHFFGGKHIKGNGNVKKEDRTGNLKFSSIEVENALELHVRQDSAYSINIEADENLLQYIIIKSSGGKLEIYTKEDANLDPTNGARVKIYVSLPVVKGLGASGASSIIGESLISSNEKLAIDLSGASDADLELKAPTVSIGMSGASGLSLRGETKDLILDGSGASHAECFGLLSENADVEVSGASSAEVFASVKIDANASGASNIKCKGKGALTKDASGASSVEKVD